MTAGLGIVVSAAMLALPVLPATAAPQMATRKVVKRVAPTFTLAFLGNERTVAAGSTTVYTFKVSRSRTFRGVLAFDVPDLPAGVTAKISSVTSTSLRMTVTTSSATLGGSAVYALRGKSGSMVRTALFRLTVVGATTTTTAASPTPTSSVVTGDFTLSTDLTSLTLSPGDTGALNVKIARTGGFAAPVSFKLEGLPTNVEAAFAPNPTQGNAALYIAPGATAPSGTYLLVITASAGSMSKSVAARLVIRRIGPFSMSLTPATISTPQGIDASTTVNISPPAGQTLVPDVTIDISAAPIGVTVLTPETTGRATKFTLRTSSTTAPGVYNFSIVGRSGANTQTVGLQLTVTANVPGFGLSAQPVKQTIARGAATSFTVTTASTGGFTGTINYAVTGLPSTASATVEATSTGATIKVTTTAATAPTTYPLVITGSSGTLVSSVPVELVVTAPAT